MVLRCIKSKQVESSLILTVHSFNQWCFGVVVWLFFYAHCMFTSALKISELMFACFNPCSVVSGVSQERLLCCLLLKGCWLQL